MMFKARKFTDCTPRKTILRPMSLGLMFWTVSMLMYLLNNFSGSVLNIFIPYSSVPSCIHSNPSGQFTIPIKKVLFHQNSEVNML